METEETGGLAFVLRPVKAKGTLEASLLLFSRFVKSELPLHVEREADLRAERSASNATKYLLGSNSPAVWSEAT